MKPILYSAEETVFDTNGVGILTDAIACNVTEELNGTYELTLRYPVKGIHYRDLVNRAIILAKPNPVADPQPFRIYRRTPTSQGLITVRARHIAYDLSGHVVEPFSANGAPASLAALKANSVPECRFSFWTDKAASSVMTVSKPAGLWSLLGGVKGSVLDCYGGEYEFDKFQVKLWTRRGSDQGVSIRYGKNLTSLEQDENCANCYTGIYPFWTSADETHAEVVLLPERVLHAEGTYNHTRILSVDFSSEWTEAPTEDMLRDRARKYIEDNQIGIPKVSFKVQHVPLDQTAEYAGRIPLERVLLGDTVSVEFPEMGVSASSRIVATDFDSLRECYNSTTVGSVKSSLSATIAQQNKENQTKPDIGMAQHIAAQLAASIMGARGGAVRLLDTNGDGMPDELYIADHQDPAQAVKVWRWNYQGWAGSKNGYNGPFVLGATFEDGLLAHMVRAANLIAGTIASADGSTFFLDLDNGILKANFSEMSIKSCTVLAAPKVTGQNTPVVTVENALSDSIEGLTIYGKTVQNGTPTPDAPVPLESVGNSGAVNTVVSGTNLCNPNGFTYSGSYTVDKDGFVNFTNTNTNTGTAYRQYPAYSINVPKGTYAVSVELSQNMEHYVSGNGSNYSKPLQSPSKHVLHDAEKIWICFAVPAATSFKFRVTINIGDTILPYETYKGLQTLTISTPNGLPGVPLGATIPDIIEASDALMAGVWWDEETQQYYISDTIDFARGVHVKRVERVRIADLYCSGRMEYPSGSGFYRFNFYDGTPKYDWTFSGRCCGLCNALTVSDASIGWNNVDESICGTDVITARCDRFSTVDAFMAWAAEVDLSYIGILTDPVETPLSAEELAQYAALANPAGHVTVISEADLSVTMSDIAAGKSVGKALETANKAQGTADAAKDSASAANGKAEAAQNTADAAHELAEKAGQNAYAYYTEVKQTAEDVGISVTELRKVVDTKAGQAQVNEITEHFRFAEDGLTITNSGTGMGINVSEKQVAFTGGDDPTTVITPNAMETTNLQVGVRLDVGGFSLIPRSNNNLSLRWTGG